MRTTILGLVSSLALTLAAACGDDDDSNSDAGGQDSGAHGGGGGSRHDGGGGDGGATMDAASDGGGSGGHDHGSGGSGAIDSGVDASADDDAGGMPDSGLDAGTDSGTDSGACNVMCNGKCCGANQVCGTVQPKTVDVGWGFGTGASVLHVVQGSTVTFGNLGLHNVNQFPNATAFTNCDFTGLTPLAISGTYSWHADTLGDFYFGCSLNTHCSANNVKKHIIVDTPGQVCAAQ